MPPLHSSGANDCMPEVESSTGPAVSVQTDPPRRFHGMIENMATEGSWCHSRVHPAAAAFGVDARTGSGEGSLRRSRTSAGYTSRVKKGGV